MVSQKRRSRVKMLRRWLSTSLVELADGWCQQSWVDHDVSQRFLNVGAMLISQKRSNGIQNVYPLKVMTGLCVVGNAASVAEYCDDHDPRKHCVLFILIPDENISYCLV